MGVVPPAWLLGRNFRENCEFVRRAQWWSAEQSREYQLSRLREILKLAYEKTRYYRRMFESVGFHPTDFQSLDQMSLLPIIDKQVVVENLADMCTTSVVGRNVDYGSTGGTSGTPLHFYLDANRSAIEYAYLTTSWERTSYQLGMPMAVLRGRMIRAHRNGFRHEYDPILRHHYYSNFHTTDEEFHCYLTHIRKIGACMLHAYPSSAHAFAKFILGAGEQVPPNVKGILLESENVYTDQVHDIERAFGAKTFSSYGHSEKLVLAAQCEHSSCYHVWPTYGYFELLDTEGKQVREIGQDGEIVGTGFINSVVPFVRYRTGDYATYAGERCQACGREHILIGPIKGRWPQGELIAADGSVISMTTLNVHDDTFRNVREYQFHQSEPGKASFCVVPIARFEESEQRRILASMNQRLQGQVVLTLELHAELVKTALGKQPRVVQKCMRAI